MSNGGPRLSIARTIAGPFAAMVLTLAGSGVVPALATGVEWHVRTNGNDATCSGQVDAPDTGGGALPRPCAFRTPQKGVNSASGGDTVLIHGGTYATAGTTVQGNTGIIGINLRSELISENDRLTIKAAGDGAVIFDGANTLSSGVTIWGTSFVTIDGITFRRFAALAAPPFTYGAAGVQIGSPDGASPALYNVLASLRIIESSLANSAGNHAEIAIWGETALSNTIRECTIESTQPVGIALGHDGAAAVAQRGTIFGNTIVRMRDATAWTGILAVRSSEWTIDGNYLAQAGAGDPATDLLRVQDGTAWSIVNNAFYRPPNAAIAIIDDPEDGAQLEEDQILNNTIECGGGTGTGIHAVQLGKSQIRNAIIVGCGSGIALSGASAETEVGYNDYFQNAIDYDTSGSPTGVTLVGGDITTDPAFVATLPRPDPYYRLATGSDAIDAGDNDHCGAAPEDGQCDMGAFQVTGLGWHVRTDGSDTNCSGLTDLPDPGTGTAPRICAFRTPQKAVNKANGGDVVVIHAGTYNSLGTPVQGNTNIIGINLRTDFDSQAHRLIIRAAGDGPVEFDGADTISSGITIWGTSHVTVDGITFRRFRAQPGGPFVYGAAGVLIGSPGSIAPSSFIVLKRLQVVESSLANTEGNHAEIAIWGDACETNTITACTIESTQPLGIVVGQTITGPLDQAGAIIDNTIVRSRDNMAWIGVLAVRSNGWTFSGNYLDQSSERSIDTELMEVQDSENWEITNNVFFRPSAAAIRTIDDSVIGGTQAEYHRILNNTIECTDAAGTGILGGHLNNSEIRNTIFTGCASALRLGQDCSQTRLGFNLFFSNSVDFDTVDAPSGHILVGSDVFADPLFEAITPRPDPYYRLQDGSPAIDAGDDDMCGVTPDDTHCDIGAFQAAASSGNHLPEQPSILLVDNITGSTAQLHGSPFIDPDVADTHLASQWQVDEFDGDFSDPAFNSGRKLVNLTTIRATGLSALTSYKARVRYQDSERGWSPWSDPTADAGAVFTTINAEAEHPRVIAVTPARGATAVSVSVVAHLTFNVPVAASSVKPGTVKLKKGSTTVTQDAGSPALDETQTMVTLTPAGLLDPNTIYTIVVRGGETGIQSRTGGLDGRDFSSNFTTETAIESSNPANEAQGVSTLVTPALVFKWALDPATVGTSTFHLRDLKADRNVPLTSVTLAGDGETVTIVPAAPLKPNRKYKIRVSPGAAGIRFLDGRMIGSAITITFKTGSSEPKP